MKKELSPKLSYDIYPVFNIGADCIFSGFDSLANRVAEYKTIIIETYSGVFCRELSESLVKSLEAKGLSVSILTTEKYFKEESEIEELAAPFLGGNDPLFGKRATIELDDLFDMNSLRSASPNPNSDISIIAGPGASLAGWPGLLIYADLPKNEIQFRARAGIISNLGLTAPGNTGLMYKRFYFFDWIILNSHKQKLLPEIDIFIDTQRLDLPPWTTGDSLREALHSISRSPFRARPWFEPGAWGGTWIRDKIAGLSKEVPNYAWSFELITPENGIVLESSSMMLEVSFDLLMYQEAGAVLGDCHTRYGTDFPIRFDFLDTFDGGNLSIQCHPMPEYIKEHFGEPFTQEETYYILDAREDSSVYLGFRGNIDQEEFRKALENSFEQKTPFVPEDFILSHPSKKHDLFLIPPGTIHGSARNNMVLEISTTPYIFTFKLYDWVRPDLNGKLRNLNISRGFENLCFDRKGDYVSRNLISRPKLIAGGNDWELYELPTHETHSYRINRYHFLSRIEIETNNKCIVMSLVEGYEITVVADCGRSLRFSYAETFVIPAATGHVSIINNSGSGAILVNAFIK